MKTKLTTIGKCPIGELVRKDYIDIFGFITKTEYVKFITLSWFWYSRIDNDCGFSFSRYKKYLTEEMNTKLKEMVNE